MSSCAAVHAAMADDDTSFDVFALPDVALDDLEAAAFGGGADELLPPEAWLLDPASGLTLPPLAAEETPPHRPSLTMMRCLDGSHAAPCWYCTPAPALDELNEFDLVGDAGGQGGLKKLRSQARLVRCTRALHCTAQRRGGSAALTCVAREVGRTLRARVAIQLSHHRLTLPPIAPSWCAFRSGTQTQRAQPWRPRWRRGTPGWRTSCGASAPPRSPRLTSSPAPAHGATPAGCGCAACGASGARPRPWLARRAPRRRPLPPRSAFRRRLRRRPPRQLRHPSTRHLRPR